MTDLQRRIGQLIFAGVPGPQLDAATRRTLEDLHVGGLILLRRNAGTPTEVAALTADLHALRSRPLVAIDHEGGRIMRLGEPFTQFPPAAALGGTRDTSLAFRVGRAMAEELASVGVDLSFAPVLDVNSNPANPVIGDRAFDSDPQRVSDMGVAMMRGLQDGGVIPCGKHFPGHGDTDTDSHVELPVVRRPRAALERTELVPFRAAIAAGVPMLMTAHVLYPAFDADHPATLARTILTDLLRNELAFGGVVASDDLAMRAIAEHQTVGDAAVATLSAGADVLLACQELVHAQHAHAAIDAAVRDGRLEEAVIDAACRRVQRLTALRATVRPPACELPNAAHRALVEEVLRKTH